MKEKKKHLQRPCKWALLFILSLPIVFSCKENPEFSESQFADHLVITTASLFSKGHPFLQPVHGLPYPALQQTIINLLEISQSNLQRNGNFYYQYDYPQPASNCLYSGSYCYLGYIDFQFRKNLENKQRFSKNIHLPDLSDIYRQLTEVENTFIRQNLERLGLKKDQSGDLIVFLESSSIKSKTPQAYDLFLKLYGENIRKKAIHLKIDRSEILSKGLSHSMIYRGRLFKDIVSPHQIAEIFENSTGLREYKYTAIPKSIPVDNHLHIMPGAYDKLVRILDTNNVQKVVLMPLPTTATYSGLKTGNEYVLKIARESSDRFKPIVMLNPDDPGSPFLLRSYIQQGALGIKLISGHHDYYAAAGHKPLSSKIVLQILDICESEKLPVLWHVNDHLFREGFLKILKDYPNVKIVLPHFAGYLTYMPNTVAALLDEYPNLYFDISFGGDPMYIHRSLMDIHYKNKEWRAVFTKYSARILFAADLVVNAGFSVAHSIMMYDLYRNLLESDEYSLHFFYPEGFNKLEDWSHNLSDLRGLGLDKTDINKIYNNSVFQ